MGILGKLYKAYKIKKQATSMYCIFHIIAVSLYR